MLALTACASPHGPCNRDDVQMAYDATGSMRRDAITLTNGCFDRMRGDLRACYMK